MNKFIKILRKFPNRKRKLNIFLDEFNRMGQFSNKCLDENDPEEAKFYWGTQVGMVYAGYIFGYITKEEYLQFIDHALKEKE